MIEEIHKRMLDSISDDYDKSHGSFFYDITKVSAIEFENIDKKINEVADKLDITNLCGKELEDAVRNKTGIERHKATRSEGYVTLTGMEGANISIGDKFSTDTLNFMSVEEKKIDTTGIIKIKVSCEREGSIGNIPKGTIKSFPVTIPGVTSVINEDAFTNGYDEEPDESLLRRYFEHIRIPATSGNKYAYIKWAKEMSGVGDAKIFSLWNGDNTVKLVIIDANKEPASLDLVKKVQDYIDPQIGGKGDGVAPIGAFCTVISAKPLTLNISFTPIRNNEVSENEMLEDVKTNIVKYLKDEIIFKKNKVSYNKIGSIILNSKGLDDFKSLKINDSAEDIYFGEEDVPILDVITIV